MPAGTTSFLLYFILDHLLAGAGDADGPIAMKLTDPANELVLSFHLNSHIGIAGFPGRDDVTDLKR